MFTGLVEEIGTVAFVLKGEKSLRIRIKAKRILDNIKLGDSICTNGVCLTAMNFDENSFSADIMAETARNTNLKNLNIGDKVNLERALKLGDRFGGHLVSGHIDGIGTIKNFKIEDNATWISISASSQILKYIIHKGSIAIDGVSLTIAYVDDTVFKVSVIPHTKEETTLLRKRIGEEVNLECDVIGKYVEKLLGLKDVSEKKGIDNDFLRKNGFI